MSNAPNESKDLINDAPSAVQGLDPWHVALYRRSSPQDVPTLICGGTIISSSVVLSGTYSLLGRFFRSIEVFLKIVSISAAHCFYNKGLKKLQRDTKF